MKMFDLKKITKMEPVKYIIINGIEIRQEDILATIDVLDSYDTLNDYDMPCDYDTAKALCEIGLLKKRYGERQATLYSIKDEELKKKILDYIYEEG